MSNPWPSVRRLSTDTPIFCALSSLLVLVALSSQALAEPEKSDLTLGFIRLTDMAPLAIAKELGYFEEAGLNITLEAQPDWPTLFEKVQNGELDAAQMLPGQALTPAINDDDDSGELIVAPMSLDLNGNAISVSNDIWAEMKPNLELNSSNNPVHPINAASLKPVADARNKAGNPLQLGMVAHDSTHNFELRYWLAAGGIHPGYYSPGDVSGNIDADAQLFVRPPPTMPDALVSGELDGYCVGEPWNQRAVMDQIGVAVIADFDIWNNNPEKILGMRESFIEANPQTTTALIQALLRAAYWLDENDDINRGAGISMISGPEYIDADAAVIGASMTGTFEYEPGDIRDQYDFNVFFRYFANYPFYSDAVWTLTQMRRWGQIAEHQDDAWYDEVARRVYRPDIFLKAAKDLTDAGELPFSDIPWDTDGYKDPTDAFIDGVTYDGRAPNAYLESLSIGLKEASPAVGK